VRALDGYITSVQPVSEETARLVRIAQYILIATAFVNLTTKDDDILVLSAYANIAAVILLIVAVNREAKEQEIAPGVTTPANRLKIIGTAVSLISNLVLTAALLKEVAIKKQTGVEQAFLPPAQTSTGAFTVSF
jgi:hypothetical protein